MAQTIKLKRSSTSGAVPSTSSLSLGEVAINTHDGKMYIKKNDGSDSIVEIGGAVASNAISSSFNLFEYTATSNQTTFSGSDSNSQTLAYSAGKVIVALNGTILKETTDYTATNGTSVVLATGAEASHELTIMAFGTFDVANVDYADVNNTPTLPTDFVSAASGGTFGGNVAINGDLTVDNVTSNSSPVATLSSLSTFNGVGSYCLAHHTSSNSSLTANTSVSGSSLRAVGFYHLISDSSSSAYYPDEDGSALSGTWRVMGEARDNGSPTTLRPATLFVRIS